MSRNNKDSVNDRMVKWTSLPAIYLWIAASGTVIFYGIFKPDIVLPSVEAFIALIAIIGSQASKSYDTIHELWKAEQTVETNLHPSVIEAQQDIMKVNAEHERTMALKALEHEHTLALKQQEHEHCLAHEKQQAELGIKQKPHKE
jgi:hypothetical protein